MEIAINTGSLSLNTHEALERAVALGFHAVEVNLQQAELCYDFNRKIDFGFYQRLAAEATRLNLRVTSVHQVAVSGVQMFSGAARGDLLKAAARITGVLGARALVVHPLDLFTSYEALERYFALGAPASPPVVEGYDECWAALVNKRLMLCLENVSYWRGAPVTNQPERLKRLAEDLAVNVVWDMHRALPLGATPALMLGAAERWAQSLGTRVGLLHVHDADGGVEHAPLRAELWETLAPVLRASPARACVLEVDARYGDEALVQSRTVLEACLIQAPA